MGYIAVTRLSDSKEGACLLAKFPGDECRTFAESPADWCANCHARLSDSKEAE